MSKKSFLSLGSGGNIVKKTDGLVFLDGDGKIPKEHIEISQADIFGKEQSLFPGDELVLEHPSREEYDTGLLVLVEDAEGSWQIPEGQEYDDLIPYRKDTDKSAVTNNTGETKTVRLIAW